jgi:hypothetical protein
MVCHCLFSTSSYGCCMLFSDTLKPRDEQTGNPSQQRTADQYPLWSVQCSMLSQSPIRPPASNSRLSNTVLVETWHHDPPCSRHEPTRAAFVHGGTVPSMLVALFFRYYGRLKSSACMYNVPLSLKCLLLSTDLVPAM